MFRLSTVATLAAALMLCACKQKVEIPKWREAIDRGEVIRLPENGTAQLLRPGGTTGLPKATNGFPVPPPPEAVRSSKIL